MEIKDLQRDEKKDVMISGRITQEDKDFLDKHDINVGKIIRYVIKTLREQNENNLQSE